MVASLSLVNDDVGDHDDHDGDHNDHDGDHDDHDGHHDKDLSVVAARSLADPL